VDLSGSGHLVARCIEYGDEILISENFKLFILK